MPPARPEKFSMVRMGSAITQATMRVTIRYLNEPTARDSSASICWVIRMPASSAPIPAPTRPATSRPAINAPMSLKRLYEMCGVIASAPKLSMEDRVCKASTTPKANPDVMMSGPARQPISKICLVISPSSKGARTLSRIPRAPKSRDHRLIEKRSSDHSQRMSQRIRHHFCRCTQAEAVSTKVHGAATGVSLRRVER